MKPVAPAVAVSVKMAKDGEPVTLADCPIGLFYCGDTLALKTEYGNNEGRIDAYIVSSGEFFWGAAPQTIASQRAELVQPVQPVQSSLTKRGAPKAAVKRILDELKDPYEGIMYENGKPRKGLWARFRAEDVKYIGAALSSVIPATKGGEEAPICPLMRDNGDPAWLQIANLFFREQMASPPIRLRDELSNMLAWARYGEALAAFSQDTDGVAKP